MIRFVDRYIPGYVFFGDFSYLKKQIGASGNNSKDKPVPKGLILVLDEGRKVIDTILI